MTSLRRDDAESVIADIEDTIAQIQRMVIRLNAYTDRLETLRTDADAGDVEPHG